METQQVGNRIRLPWENPNAPVTAPSRRPGLGSRQVSLAQSVNARRIRFLNFLPLAVKNRYVRRTPPPLSPRPGEVYESPREG